MIKIDLVTHQYDRAVGPIFSPVSFEIKPNECIGLSGPSGCGKTTLAKIIAGHLRPSHGRIVMAGQEITGRPNRDIILISQESDLFPWQTVRRHLSFVMSEPNDRQIADWLDLAGLGSCGNFYPYQLSGGMKKRLALIRALALAPRLLILDEAFASLDVKSKTGLYRDLESICRKTRTALLLISHDLEEIERLADRKIFLDYII